MTLSHPDSDLATIAANSRPDGMLQAVANLATYYVGLLVNGMTVYGRVTNDRDFAEQMDAENARILDRVDRTGADWPRLETKVRNVWTRKADEVEQQDSELMARNEETSSIEDMTDEDARLTIKHRATALTLAEAKVIPPGAPAFDVPLLRVQIAQVAAWWLMPTDESGSVSFTHPG